MNVDDIINNLVTYVQVNPLAAISGAIVLVFLLFWKPKLIIILLGGGIAAFGIMHLFARLSNTGLSDVKIPYIN